MRILIVSEACHPLVNGVVTTLETTAGELRKAGHEIQFIGPDSRRPMTFPMPGYQSISLEFFGHARIGRAIDTFKPHCIHIATEGPLGWAARHECRQRKLPFTTSYHTRFPEYIATRMPFGLASVAKTLTYKALRRFHQPSSAVMVSTQSMQQELENQKFDRLVRWSRGVNTEMFKPYGKDLPAYAKLPRPILLNVGRVSKEKNLDVFLSLKTPGSKVIVGDGPDLPRLRAQYRDAHFLGELKDENLVRHYAAADVFVFPSYSDTFGLVLLEAAACGTRIAAFPAPGPVDIFSNDEAQKFAALDNDLGRAIEQALKLPDDPAIPRAFAENFSWADSTAQFYSHLQALKPKESLRKSRLRFLAR